MLIPLDQILNSKMLNVIGYIELLVIHYPLYSLG